MVSGRNSEKLYDFLSYSQMERVLGVVLLRLHVEREKVTVNLMPTVLT